MEVYKLYLRTVEDFFQEINKQEYERWQNGEISSNFYNLLKMNTKIACIHDVKGFLDCLLMFGKISKEEVEIEMNKVREKFSND